MESVRLILLIEMDFVLPSAFDADGSFHAGNKIPVNINNQTNILEVAEIIRMFCIKAVGESNIATDYIFAESIKIDDQKAIISTMKQNGFSPRSFSTNTISLYVREVEKNWLHDGSKLGDSIMLICSAADSIWLSCAIYDGTTWLIDPSHERIKGLGESPLQSTIIDCVITDIDRANGFLVTEKDKVEEREYQRRNVEYWTNIYKNSDKDFYLPDFTYKRAPADKYSCYIDKKSILAAYRSLVNPAILKINEYRQKVCGQNLKAIATAGHAFADAEFTMAVLDRLGKTHHINLPNSVLPKIIQNHMTDCPTEDFLQFDIISEKKRRQQQTVRKWLENAQRVKVMLDRLKIANAELSIALKQDSTSLKNIIKEIDNALKTSNFDEAQKIAEQIILPSIQVSNQISNARDILSDLQNFRPVLESLVENPGARVAASQIDKLQVSLDGMFQENSNNKSRLQGEKAEIQRLKGCYSEYAKLMKEFRQATLLNEKRKIIETIQNSKLTRETLPDIYLPHVTAILHGEVVRSGIFLTKPSAICIRFSLQDDKVLPCDAMLNVSNNIQVEANSGDNNCIAVKIQAGEHSFSTEIPLPDNRINTKKPIRIALFTAPGVLDQTAIECSILTINSK